MKFLILVLFVLLSWNANASPFPDEILTSEMELPELNDGFARVEFVIPQDSELLHVELYEVTISNRYCDIGWNRKPCPTETWVRIYYVGDPLDPTIWRRIEFIEPPNFILSPVDFFIGVQNGLVIFDEGEFEQPID